VKIDFRAFECSEIEFLDLTSSRAKFADDDFYCCTRLACVRAGCANLEDLKDLLRKLLRFASVSRIEAPSLVASRAEVQALLDSFADLSEHLSLVTPAGEFELAEDSATERIEVSWTKDSPPLATPSRVVVKGDFDWSLDREKAIFLRELDLRELALNAEFADGRLPHSCRLQNWGFLEFVELPLGLRRLKSFFFRGCTRLRGLNLGSLTSLEFIGWEVFAGCFALRELSFPPQWAGIDCGEGMLLGCGVLSLDLSEIPSVCGIADSFCLDGASCLENLIVHRRVTPSGRGLWALRSLTLGRAEFACGRPSQIRFTSMIGGCAASFAAGIANSVVFGEVSALGARESRPALLP
jgi:hypothetical protein